jgi:hypothetical protein
MPIPLFCQLFHEIAPLKQEQAPVANLDDFCTDPDLDTFFNDRQIFPENNNLAYTFY